MTGKAKKEKEEGGGILDGIGKTLKKIGVTEDVPEPGDETSQAPKQEGSEVNPLESTIVPEKPMADERSKQILLVAIAQEGPVLKQFNELLESFKDLIDEETKRYVAAMRALEKQGHALPDVMQGVTDQLRALREEKEKFSQTLADQEDNLSQRQKDVEKLGAQILDYQKKIKDLENQKSALMQKVASDRQKLDKNKAGFEAAADEVETIIKEQGEKIKRLKGGK